MPGPRRDRVIKTVNKTSLILRGGRFFSYAFRVSAAGLPTKPEKAKGN